MKTIRLLAVTLLISSAGVGPALAFDVPFRWYRTYYAEPQLVNKVGEKMLECTGSYMQEGVITPYYEEHWYEACN